MLPSSYSQLAAILFGVVGILLYIRAYFMVKRAYSNIEKCVQWVKENNSTTVSMRRMAKVEATLTDLCDSYESLLDQHRKLRARISMRKLRSERKEDDILTGPVPVDEAGKAAYKSTLRAQLRKSGRL